jgi:hypothetical protein
VCRSLPCEVCTHFMLVAFAQPTINNGTPTHAGRCCHRWKPHSVIAAAVFAACIIACGRLCPDRL